MTINHNSPLALRYAKFGLIDRANMNSRELRTEFIYREFYDFPKSILVTYRGQTFWLDAPFLDEIDDYQQDFSVYWMLPLSKNDIEGDWNELRKLTKLHIGNVAVEELRLDESRRKTLDATFLERLCLGHKIFQSKAHLHSPDGTNNPKGKEKKRKGQ